MGTDRPLLPYDLSPLDIKWLKSQSNRISLYKNGLESKPLSIFFLSLTVLNDGQTKIFTRYSCTHYLSGYKANLLV